MQVWNCRLRMHAFKVEILLLLLCMGPLQALSVRGLEAADSSASERQRDPQCFHQSAEISCQQYSSMPTNVDSRPFMASPLLRQLSHGRGTWEPPGLGRPAIAPQWCASIPGSVGPGVPVDDRPAPEELGPPFQVGGEPDFGPATGMRFPAIAFDGTNYLGVWQAWVKDSWDIVASRVNPSGTVLDTLGIWISASSEQQWKPKVAFNGTYYLVAWAETSHGDWDDSSIYGARVTATGEVLDAAGIPICTAPGSQSDVSLASDGRNWLAVWTDERRGDGGDVYGARVTPEGAVLDPDGIPVSTSSHCQDNPEVAFGGGHYFVAWDDTRRGTLDIYGSRVDLEGDVMDPDGIPISQEPRAQAHPSIDFNGTDYVVVWLDNRDVSGRDYEIYGTTVSALGEVADVNGSPISTGSGMRGSLSVASNAADYAVVWCERQSADTLKWDIKAARVASSGEVIDLDPIVIATNDVAEAGSDIASDGTDYTVVWEDWDWSFGISIYATRLTRSGLITDPEGMAIALGPNRQMAPDVAFDGNDYLAVWLDYRDRARQVYGTRVSASGAALDPGGIAISNAAASSSPPVVAFDGTDYMVAYAVGDSTGRGSDIYLSRVSRSGAVLDTLRITQSTPETPQTHPTIAFDGTNYMLFWMQGHYSGYYGYVYNAVGTRLSRSGDVLDPDLIDMPLGVSYFGGPYPDIAFGGTSYVVVSGRGGARVSPSGEVLDPEGFVISPSATYVGMPAVAFDGTGFMAVWEVQRNRQFDIRGARIDASGTVLDPEGIEISAAAGDQRVPDIAFDGRYYMVSWIDRRNDEGDVYGCRVTTSGEVLDPDGLPIARGTGNQSSPAMTRGASGQLLVVYSSAARTALFDAERIWARLWNQVAHRATVLLATAPNPFRYSVQISYSLPSEARVRLAVFDPAGRLVKTIVRGYRGPGWNYETWDGRDEEGRDLPSGVYFVRIRSKYGSASEKCVIVR